MKNIKRYNLGLSIKQSILLLILLPSFLITTVLTTYLVISRQSDAQNELLLQANSALSYISNSSELPLFSADIPALQRLGSAVILNNEIKSVTYFDSNKKVISTSGEKINESVIYSSDSFYSKEKNSQWIFQTPIFNSEIEVDDYKDDELDSTEKTVPPKYLGWVQLIADKKPLLAKQKKILLAGFGLGLALFGLLAFFAHVFSRSLTIPLHTLTETIRELEGGNLESRVSVTANGEIKELVDGVNQLADKVKISNKRLNLKIKEATQQLTSTLLELEARNIDLELTGNQLINANNAKDEFLASVSHELRTPLTSIIGYAELLKKSDLEKEQIDQVRTISQASEILLQLIDNILDFSKLESESLELEHISFNVNNLLNDVQSLHMPAAMAKGIKLNIVSDLNLPKELIGDPLRIKQVFNNLIQNAVKFTNQGSVKISVSPLDNEFGLLVKITDTGIGIKKEHLSQLFNPFNQLDASITRRFGGTGLGLVICKKLISQLGGTIKVNSEIGKGTEIIFSILNVLPVKKHNDIQQSIIEKHETSDFHQSLKGNLVVIAEDNHFVKNLLIKIFENEGAEVIAKNNGLLALEEIKNTKPDFVVLDYQMPTLDGINTCKEIRKLFSKNELPVVLLTADVMNTNKKEIKNIGINKIIYKPIQGNELIDCAQEFIFNKKNSNKNKVLDLIPDDLLKDELINLQQIIIRNFEAKDYKNLKKYIHQLCGVAGPTSQYKKLWNIAKSLDLKVKDKKYDDLEGDIDVLKSIRI